ncbi:patatin-like phospholipase family protein [Aquihabitans daechungensis]|uniref:patatin-like phospholipase family protein n=1 Tax=Aquihabitans daechungensis TaxID=1052257 RepID=UPI003BA1023C
MTSTAFVLSGGGSLGAVQVGMLQALSDHRIEPDLVIGTSVGALNAAYVAGHGTGSGSLADLATIWTGLRRRDVFPFRPLRMGAAALGRAPSLCHDGPLRDLIRKHVPFARLEDSQIPVQVIATDVRSGSEVVLTTGDAVDAIMASAAIPAVFPAVHIDGRDLVDGGVADNASISQAVACGAEHIYVLPTGYACALDEAPAAVLASALQALTLLIEQRLILEVAHYAEHADIRVLPPLCPLSVSSADFRSGALLIEQAHTTSNRWLDRSDTRSAHPEQVLSLHGHHIDTHPLPTHGDRTP